MTKFGWLTLKSKIDLTFLMLGRVWRWRMRTKQADQMTQSHGVGADLKRKLPNEFPNEASPANPTGACK
jgi:hypothetical protein